MLCNPETSGKQGNDHQPSKQGIYYRESSRSLHDQKIDHLFQEFMLGRNDILIFSKLIKELMIRRVR